MQTYDVVTVGAAVLDIFMRSEKFKVVSAEGVPGGIAICQVYGGKMEVEDVNMFSGGGATNVAVSLAKKELKTAVICEMGNDPQALIVHRDLEEVGVDTRFVVQEQNETTAVSVILIAEDGGRSIMVHRGASAMLTRRDLPLEQIQTRWLHISSLGGNVSLLKQLLNWAKQHQVRVSLNPGMKEIAKREELIKLLPSVEVLFVNRNEAGMLYDQDFLDEKTWKRCAVDWGVKTCVITDGERGGKLCIDNKCQDYMSRKLKEVVDTTGAGDAFASGFVAAMLYGHDYTRAVNWGVENARAILKTVGAKKGLLNLAQIKNY